MLFPLKQLTINEELNSNTPHSSGNDFAKIESILSSAKSQIKTTKKNHTNRLWLKRQAFFRGKQFPDNAFTV